MDRIRAENITDTKSEAGIIASLMLKPEMYFYAEDKLVPEHFSNAINRAVYAAISILAKDGIVNIDPYMIHECWSKQPAMKHYVDEIQVSELNEMQDMAYGIARRTEQEYNFLVKCVLDAAFRRDMLNRLRDCEKWCNEGTEEDIKVKVYQALDSVMSSYSSWEEIPQYKDIVDDKWEEIKKRYGTGYSGIPFKFDKLNEYVTIERGELVIFGAQQKVGKSIMLLNCAVDLLRKNYSVLYIDSELSDRLFTGRILSHISGVEYRKVTSGGYTEEEESRILNAIEWIKQQKFCHIYMPFFDEQTIYTTVKRQNHIQPIDVLIVDYFKSTGKDTDAFATYAAMGRCVDVIKNEIAGDMNIAAIGAAQATVNNKLADSAKIARNASTIVMLIDKTADEIEQDGKECGNKKAIVTVNRNGMQHAEGEYIDLQFNGNLILYEQAKKQHTPQTPF